MKRSRRFWMLSWRMLIIVCDRSWIDDNCHPLFFCPLLHSLNIVGKRQLWKVDLISTGSIHFLISLLHISETCRTMLPAHVKSYKSPMVAFVHRAGWSLAAAHLRLHFCKIPQVFEYFLAFLQIMRHFLAFSWAFTPMIVTWRLS